MQENTEHQASAHKNEVHFSEPRQPQIVFNSRFDSGNLQRVLRVAYDQYSIWTACDAQGSANEGYPKSWFYFEVGGFLNRKVTFSIHRMHFLYAMTKRPHLYRPVYRLRLETGKCTPWQRLPHPIISLTLNDEEELVLKFDFFFDKFFQSAQFAFTYPYSYEECRRDMANYQQQYASDVQLFVQRHELTKSVQGRSLDLLLISSHQGKQGYEAVKPDKYFLPSEVKVTKFRTNKPIIFISARVHPIQTPSSYCMQGIIQFLLSKQDLRAHLLRKYFVFVLVPMLNPDGVSNGHCRMDALNQNLNRYYTNPDPSLQPSCYAVKKLCEHYNQTKRLFMYLDLHAHPAYKGNFTFGNAIFDYIEQVQSQMFPKILSQNCINFEFEQCIFSRKHMKAKDRNEDVSKEGCGRVVFYREFSLIHSYTLECGYHLNTFNNALAPVKDATQQYMVKYKVNEKGQKIYEMSERVIGEKTVVDKHKYDLFKVVDHQLDDVANQYYKAEIPLYKIETYENLGRNILISLLDVWDRNPYTRLTNKNGDRKEIAEKQAKLDRFRKEQAGIKTKQKKIVELIEEQLYGDWHRRNVFNVVSVQHAREQKKMTLQFHGKFIRSKYPPQSENNCRLQEIVKEEEGWKEGAMSQPGVIDQTEQLILLDKNGLQKGKRWKGRGPAKSTKQNNKEGNIPYREIMASNKFQEEPFLIQRKIEVASLSNKMIRYSNFPVARLKSMANNALQKK